MKSTPRFEKSQAAASVKRVLFLFGWVSGRALPTHYNKRRFVAIINIKYNVNCQNPYSVQPGERILIFKSVFEDYVVE